MRVADRVSDVADRMQTRRLESKRETLDRDNDRLRTELRTIKQELDRERSTRDELIDALKKGEGTVKADKVKVKTKRRGGLLRMLIIGGGAYVLGTRAGRERYDQIKGWATDMKDRVRSNGGGDEWSSMSSGGSGMTSGSIGGTSGMSGSTGSSTGTGSTSGSTGSTSGSTSGTTGTTGGTTTGSTGTSSTSGSSGTTSGSTGTGSTGTGSTGTGSTGTGSTGTGSTGSTGSSSKRSGSGSTS